MTERPILFSAPMVRAILAGTKTQTRRVLKQEPIYDGRFAGGWKLQGENGREAALCSPMIADLCPYGQPGDQLWVRETWGLHAYGDDTDWVKGSCTGLDLEDSVITYRADWGPMQESCHWRPSIHMPRSASRLSLEITSVRVERLQDISADDLAREGLQEVIDAGVDHDGTPRDAWRALWTQINGHESWAANPWVWVVDFTRTK
jgi:hypothetical protein